MAKQRVPCVNIFGQSRHKTTLSTYAACKLDIRVVGGKVEINSVQYCNMRLPLRDEYEMH